MKLIRGLLCAAFLPAGTAAARAQTPVPLTVSVPGAFPVLLSIEPIPSRGLSEFLIVADARPMDTVIASKFLWQLGATLPAIIGVTTLMDTLKAQDALVIPDVWRAACDPADVAGAWRSAAETLRFRLRVKASRSPPFPLSQ
jgi:hypothetical protein